MKESKDSSGGLFLSLKDGDKKIVIFRGDPYCFYQVYKEKEEHKTWAEGRSFKFRLNVLVRDGDVWKPMIFSQGITVAGMISDVKEKYGLNTIYEIKRKGSTKDDTTYNIMYERALNPDEVAKLETFKLLALVRSEGQPESIENKSSNINELDDIPF